MNERSDIQFGQPFIQNLQDDNGYVNLAGATNVFLQYRVDCGAITNLPATILNAATGQVSAVGIPVGSYQVRWVVATGSTGAYYPDYGWDQLTVRAIDACATFELFVSNATQTVFPEGEPENLLRNHRQYIEDALIDLQQKIPCARVTHRDRLSMSNTFLHCGATVTDAPRGFIAQLYAVTQDDCCAKRYLKPIDHDEMEQVLSDHRNCGSYLVPTSYSAYGCLYYGDYSGETDTNNRPSTKGSYCSLHNGLLYLYPWLQSNEVLVIEWDGIKRSWKDTDEVSWDREIQDAVEHYLDSKVAYREDCDLNRLQIARGLYEGLVAKLIWQCRKERRIERKVHYFTNCGDFCNAGRMGSQGGSGGDGDGNGNGNGNGGHPIDCCEGIAQNYTEMRTITDPRVFPSVKVLGYGTPYDGGGGVFIREPNSPPQVDNDGNIIPSLVPGASAYYWRKWL